MGRVVVMGGRAEGQCLISHADRVMGAGGDQSSKQQLSPGRWGAHARWRLALGCRERRALHSMGQQRGRQFAHAGGVRSCPAKRARWRGANNQTRCNAAQQDLDTPQHHSGAVNR